MGVAVLLNQVLVDKFIVPTCDKLKKVAHSMYIRENFPNQLPSLKYLKALCPEFKDYYKLLRKMYKHYGALNFEKLERDRLI